MTDDYGLLNPKAEQSAAVDLMECPFCGGIPKYSKEGTEHPWMVSVVRCKCGVSLGCSGHGAAELWNTRAVDSVSHRCGFNAGGAFAKYAAEEAQPLTQGQIDKAWDAFRVELMALGVATSSHMYSAFRRSMLAITVTTGSE